MEANFKNPCCNLCRSRC